jgi:hypothetical protein
MSNTNTSDPATDLPTEGRRGRRPAWAPSVGKVVYGLIVHRARLRRAARQAGDPAASKRLRRLARRRRGDVEELVRTVPPDVVAPRPIDSKDVVPSAVRQLALANEIASLAATLRSNRRVRVAIERTLDKEPPARLAGKLSRIAADLEIEAGTLNARLRDVAVRDVVPSPIES